MADIHTPKKYNDKYYIALAKKIESDTIDELDIPISVYKELIQRELIVMANF